ncbi:hypothetical protein EELLY_v1c00520 [Entomoplasma ellychniae]|uniref:Uncharacterized protein n=2 Tax=Entomoplasmataceae TaxID=33925 RepID=A0A2S5RI34_9MOLU|nr:hypothetical protein [Entomoplasma ellychniae]PPE04378.1 hypothetical protein EELLY_v1c00520 [Entomoplasma ellychniae]PPE06825.1 hypothetical protein MCORR_v1c04560 [Mesoplasma corruscae]
MYLDIRNQFSLNSNQYITVEWLDVVFFHAQILETNLQTQSLSLK